MKTSIVLLKKYNLVPQKVVRVPSQSEPGTYHYVRIWKNRIECDCVAYLMGHECRHIKLVKNNEKIKSPN